MLKLTAPAKVNLRLKITGRRPDGYHLLDMVMVKLDLFDEIEFELGGDETRVESDNPGLPVDSSNTVRRAAELVREESGKRFELTVRIKKKIPVSAGLGGGSSDAAATLKALNSGLQLGWNQERLIELGTRIGADVPFFLTDGPQIVTGIGEILKPVNLPPLSLVLVNPGFPVSTRDAYRWLDAKGFDEAGDPKGPLTSQPPLASFPPLENDLERVVIPRYPVLGRLKDLLARSGALGTLMSGSGSTVFGLFSSQGSRDRGYEMVCQEADPKWWLWSGRTV